MSMAKKILPRYFHWMHQNTHGTFHGHGDDKKLVMVHFGMMIGLSLMIIGFVIATTMYNGWNEELTITINGQTFALSITMWCVTCCILCNCE